MERADTRPVEPDMLKLTFGGHLQTKEYVIGELVHWGPSHINPEKMWDDAVKAGRIKKVDKKSLWFDMYDLDGEWSEKQIPDGTLASRWCELRGNREAIHTSFRRWIPHSYDRIELDNAIDASLEEYPDALKAYPEQRRHK